MPIVRIKQDDGTWKELHSIKGNKGDKGDQGERGEQGPAGTTDFNNLKNKPTKLSQFENDSNFTTSDNIIKSTETKTPADSLVYSSLVADTKFASKDKAIALEQTVNIPDLDDNNPLGKILRTPGYAGIIHSWGIIGDSLSSGESLIYNGNTWVKNVDYYYYSWGQRFGKAHNVDVYNFSYGGATALSWITATPTYKVFDSTHEGGIGGGGWGFAKKPENHKQAYVIALGVNDYDDLATYPLGDPATDIKTYDPSTDSYSNTLTFTGFYASIIQRLKGIVPTCKIFLTTPPKYGEWSRPEMSPSIRAIYEYFKSIYPNDIFLIDLDTYLDVNLSEGAWDWHGHGSAMAYEYMSWVFGTYIDWIIRKNPNAFNTTTQTDPEPQFDLAHIIKSNQISKEPSDSMFYSALATKKLLENIDIEGGGGTDYSAEISDLQTTLNGFLHPTKYAMPCASGFTNFSNGSLYWKTPDNMVHLTAIITVNNSLSANGTVFNMPNGYRPAATVVIPAICSYESNYMPEAGEFNFNANGTAVWYGPTLGANRHIMINAVYPAA